MPLPTAAASIPDTCLLADLLASSAARQPDAPALTHGQTTLTYGALQARVAQCAAGLLALGLARGERVGIYLDKCVEAVEASFAAAAAGLVMVPINPLLRAEQVGFILRDCQVRLLLTTTQRHALLAPLLANCHDLRHVLLTSAAPTQASASGAQTVGPWAALAQAAPRSGHRVIDSDMAAILYTSGSSGQPKGVVLSHRNLVAGAKSVAAYLHNGPHDALLAVLPLSFDAGFSQLTTGFYSGARVVLLNYLLPRDVLLALQREAITGMTAVPALYIQLAQMEWPTGISGRLRYFANTGGHMPRDTLNALRRRLPQSSPYLMYGLTEAFRSTYLPPEEVDRRTDSIGRAIPNAEILVLREDGSACGPDEPGELVHRGALVGLGYWNDPAKTAERYRPLPARAPGFQAGLPLPETVVFSGDTVRQDADGFLYFIARRDEMIKSSGYRISPTEVEEVLYATGLVGECVAFGVPHPTLGQVVQVMATPAQPDCSSHALLQACRANMPPYMVPTGVALVEAPLPRNPNGKMDRKWLAERWRAQHGP